MFSCLVLFLLLVLSVSYLSLVRNPVWSLLSLMIAVISLSFFLLLFGVDYLAVTLLILYVSAISVLFVFLLMMLPSYTGIEIYTYNILSFVGFWLFVFFLISWIFYSNFAVPQFFGYLFFLDDFVLNGLWLVGLFLFGPGFFYVLILVCIFFFVLMSIRWLY